MQRMFFEWAFNELGTSQCIIGQTNGHDNRIYAPNLNYSAIYLFESCAVQDLIIPYILIIIKWSMNISLQNLHNLITFMNVYSVRYKIVKKLSAVK